MALALFTDRSLRYTVAEGGTLLEILKAARELALVTERAEGAAGLEELRTSLSRADVRARLGALDLGEGRVDKLALFAERGLAGTGVPSKERQLRGILEDAARLAKERQVPPTFETATPTASGRVREAASGDRVSETEVRRALETFRTTDRQDYRRRALRTLIAAPDVARDLLIGRGDDFTADQLDQLYLALRPDGLDILTEPDIDTALVWNRGEIALRLVKAMADEGIYPVVASADFDTGQSWIRRARQMGARVTGIGGANPAESYLLVQKVLDAADRVGAQAVHPGYGFLSEDVGFAQALFDNGLVLMGPSVASMRMAGDKDVSKEVFRRAGIPVTLGTGRHTNAHAMLAEGLRIGLPFPWRLKAVGGGGGKGQNEVYNAATLPAVFQTLAFEAQRAFGNGALLAEMYVPDHVHVEVQFIADRFGNILILLERECTLQDKNQKMVEIYPAAIFERFPGLRRRLFAAAGRAARAMGYTGHGTFEAMVDPRTGQFYALEVNARIQVERGVTELATGFDIVHEAIRIARGLPLSRRQRQIRGRGGVVEVRLKARAPGLITQYSVPDDPHVRLEATYNAGDRVPAVTDPNLGLILVTGKDRLDAIRRAAWVARRVRLEGREGFRSDLDITARLLRTGTVEHGDYHTGFVRRWLAQGGDDLHHLPFRAERLLEEGPPTPVHLEIGSYRSDPTPLLAQIEGSLGGLLIGNEEGVQTRLIGPIAERLRNSEELRGLTSSGNGGRRLYVQANENGFVRRLAVFGGGRPLRFLVTTGARSRRDEGGRPIAIAWDLQLQRNAEGGLQLVGEIYREGENEPVGRDLAERPADGGPYLLFKGTAAELRVNLRETRHQTTVEVRDRNGDILLSLAPHQVARNLGERVVSLYDLAQSPETGDEQRKGILAEVNTALAGLAALATDSEARGRSIEAMVNSPLPLASHLAAVVTTQHPAPALWGVIDEVLARREVAGRALSDAGTGLPQRRVLEFRRLDDYTSLTLFEDRDERGGLITRAAIRLLVSETDDLYPALTRAYNWMAGVRQAHPESTDNVIEIGFRETEQMRSDDILRFLGVGVGLKQDLDTRDHSLRRVTFAVLREGQPPDYFTFRHLPTGEGGRTERLTEDPRFRHLHPQVASQIELDRLRSFELERDQRHSGGLVHLFYGFNRGAGVRRLFGTVIVPTASARPGDVGGAEVPEVEAALVRGIGVMQRSLAAYKPAEGPAPTQPRLALTVRGTVDLMPGDLSGVVERMVLRHGAALRGLDLEKLVIKINLRDPSSPHGYRPALVRVSRDEAGSFSTRTSIMVRAWVQEAADGSAVERLVLVSPERYDRWMKEPSVPLGPTEWRPADQPIRVVSPAIAPQ